MAAKKSSNNGVTIRSKRFTTTKVKAMFPKLNKPDEKYDNYSVSVDLLDHPELEKALKAQVSEFLPAAMKEANSTKKPATDWIKVGEYTPKGSDEALPYRRVQFSMKAERKIKGKVIAQRPRLVDAKLQSMEHEPVFGGSEVRIAYYLQYHITPAGVAYLSLKLDSVQVISRVGPGGEVAISSLFDEEEGYVAEQGASDNDEPGDDGEAASSGRDF